MIMITRMCDACAKTIAEPEAYLHLDLEARRYSPGQATTQKCWSLEYCDTCAQKLMDKNLVEQLKSWVLERSPSTPPRRPARFFGWLLPRQPR